MWSIKPLRFGRFRHGSASRRLKGVRAHKFTGLAPYCVSCVSIRAIAQRTMTITKPDRRLAKIVAVALGAALLLTRGTGWEPLKTAAAQTTTAATSTNLETLEVGLRSS